MNTKRLTMQIILVAVSSILSVAASAQTPQEINVTIRPSQTVEERVADEVKAQELKKAAEQKAAAEEAARIAELNPKNLLRRAHIIYINSDSDFFEVVQLQNALRKREEFDLWQLAIVDGWEKRNVADIMIEIDRPLFTYIFTYQITNRANGIVLATGKITAFDGNIAAPKIAERIIEDLRIARGEAKTKR
ncbi:MAG: hypothetical protein C5B55_01505 [Blastocatellia bacterium]|nr:MAG: hypothetical protein C5B55_01505 [Blastocatellia bacterium]